MRLTLLLSSMIGLFIMATYQTCASSEQIQKGAEKGRTFYVRQTVGNDANNGMSSDAAWSSISKLSVEMRAGDVAYVGPGLYREEITVMNSGSADKKITFIADTTGQHTGDAPGVVMITGAEPADEGIFEPHQAPNVYTAKFTAYRVLGIAEMNGSQYRYTKVKDRKDIPLPEGVSSEIDIVSKTPSSFFYDVETKNLYIHTSDGKHPNNHELEFSKRGNGISIVGKHYITVIGFTFRHMGDAGINFFKGSGNGMAINNTSYGNRQGIRVYNAKDILIYGNILFRNENSGVYFAAESAGSFVGGNIAYENIKGIRWSSQSVDGVAVDNTVFDNHEAGIAVENADRTTLRRNRLVNNKKYQLLVIQSNYSSEDNCFHNGSPEQLVSDFVFTKRYRTLAEYSKEQRQDMHSREGNCGQMTGKIDVRKLHEETKGYTERFREKVKKPASENGEKKS